MFPRTIRLPRTVERFASVGVANTAIDLTLFWLLRGLLGVLCANVVSTSAGMAFSFVANGRHTFGATRLTAQQALGFLATNGFSMWLLQPLVIGVAHTLLDVPLMLAKVLALASSMVTNFVLYRYIVYKVRPEKTPAGLVAAPEAARR
jgi:putative flippase GtrA